MTGQAILSADVDERPAMRRNTILHRPFSPCSPRGIMANPIAGKGAVVFRGARDDPVG
jgi:hypothetical protein